MSDIDPTRQQPEGNPHAAENVGKLEPLEEGDEGVSVEDTKGTDDYNPPVRPGEGVVFGEVPVSESTELDEDGNPIEPEPTDEDASETPNPDEHTTSESAASGPEFPQP